MEAKFRECDIPESNLEPVIIPLDASDTEEESGDDDEANDEDEGEEIFGRYRKATGLAEKKTLGRVLPVALGGPAARRQPLVGEELEEKTQAPDEPFAEYLRAMQELLQIADPNATNKEQVERVVRQAHPTFSRYLRGRPFGSLSELALEARRVQADILAELSGEPSGNPWELTDDALEPGSRPGGSSAVHATEFRPTGAHRIAAAQEQAAADPLPQRGEKTLRHSRTPRGPSATGQESDIEPSELESYLIDEDGFLLRYFPEESDSSESFKTVIPRDLRVAALRH
ncbi:hypothetical protein HPB47_018808 [Ixodes persulcatus]|uniref:Uncharacterized protein n=1 Tax=Ixodes persulcatus TaxID=34615 RepID=A0AC60QKN3_IXOPE|nr:hypothetical protein HPB47_018808 [Ixodes persulcatus]